MIDRWKALRAEMSMDGRLLGNTEPDVKLIGITTVVSNNVVTGTMTDVESQVAQAAAVSSGVNPKDTSKLNKKLIDIGHHTPLEAVQYNFHISGISKACSAQISRHRMSGHVSKSRRFQEASLSFVYPLLDKVTNQTVAENIYEIFSDQFTHSQNIYHHLRDNIEMTKTESRLVIPVSSATERIWWINARSLRNFLQLRLPADAESEIRRLAYMITDVVYHITPSLFEDIRDRYPQEV